MPKKSVKVETKTLKNEKNEIKTDVKIQKRSNKTPKYYVVIDYPSNGEWIADRNYYCVRIGASSNGYVEVSINGQDFSPCRHSVGYWWYDWSNLPSGKNTIVARLKDGQTNKTLKKSEPVVCIVK